MLRRFFTSRQRKYVAKRAMSFCTLPGKLQIVASSKFYEQTSPDHLSCCSHSRLFRSLLYIEHTSMASCTWCKSFSLSSVCYCVVLTFDYGNSLSTFPLVFEEVYDQSIGMASLNYLSLGIGFVIGLQICAPINDRVSDAVPIIFHRTWRRPTMDIGN